MYDSFRKKLGATRTSGIPVWQAAICGVTAGGLAQWMASPADLVKVQCQMEGKRRLMGLKPRVHGAGDALKQIIMRGGIKGLWKGSVPNVQRAALVNLGTILRLNIISMNTCAIYYLHKCCRRFNYI